MTLGGCPFSIFCSYGSPPRFFQYNSRLRGTKVRSVRIETSMITDQTNMIADQVKRFRGELVSKAHRLLHHPTLGSRVIKKKKTVYRNLHGHHVSHSIETRCMRAAPTTYALHPAPYTLRRTPYALRPTPCIYTPQFL